MNERSINLAELDFFTIADAAKIMNLSAPTIISFINKGKLKALNLAEPGA